MISTNVNNGVRPSLLDLTTLLQVNAHINNNNAADQNLLQAYITAASLAIMRYCNINPFVETVTEKRDGNGNNAMTTQKRPIISVESVRIYPSAYLGTTLNSQPLSIPAGGFGMPGFDNDPSRITLNGFTFTMGINNVLLIYRAGYSQTFTDLQAVADNTVTLIYQGAFMADLGVIYGDSGDAFVLVDSNPAEGQYTVTAAGVYGFSDDDDAVGVIITYRYGQIPADIIQACNEWVGQTYNRRNHIDLDSKGVSGGSGVATTAFSRIPMPREVKSVLDQFKTRFVP